GVCSINGEGEDVRVVNHALMNGVPSCSTVQTSPRQMGRTSINDLRVLRVESQGDHSLEFRMIRRRDAMPFLASIFSPVDAVHCTNHYDVGIFAVNGQ